MELASAAREHRGRLKLVLGLTSTYLIVEVVGGILTGSLALIADAAHMLTDVIGLSMALIAIWFGNRRATPERTYGFYRAEILAALANAVVLFGVSAYILYEAWRRFQNPPEVQAGAMLIVASVGLLVNLTGAWLLHGAAKDSLNMRGAYLEVISDLLGSIGVMVAAGVMAVTGWYYADPLFSVGIGLFIIPRTWRLLRESLGILLEGTPAHINLAELREALETTQGVAAVHDLHIWSLTSGMDMLTAHVVVADGAPRRELLATLQSTLRERFSIEHSTLQLEDPDAAEQAAHT